MSDELEPKPPPYVPETEQEAYITEQLLKLQEGRTKADQRSHAMDEETINDVIRLTLELRDRLRPTVDFYDGWIDSDVSDYMIPEEIEFYELSEKLLPRLARLRRLTHCIKVAKRAKTKKGQS